MTSRREFFGLLAAAPLVAPVVVKEMAETLATPKYATGGYLDTLSKYAVHPGKWRTFRFKDWSYCAYFDHYPFESDVADYRSAIIPNRLYGAQINADGEAI